MDETLAFGSGGYLVMLGVLAVSRGMDFLSTWVATPNLVLEGNPLARRLGWRGGAVLNVGVCLLVAMWTVPALAVSTMSLMVAARNFQVAWLMRSMGEEAYRDWYLDRLLEAPASLYLLCLAGQSLPVAAVGGALMWFSDDARVIWLAPLGAGLGLVGYALAVVMFSLLGFWRLRRSGAFVTTRLTD